jgi:hypothetical protein
MTPKKIGFSRKETHFKSLTKHKSITTRGK